MKTVEFQVIKNGEKFSSTSGEFVKINDNCAKRTEAHWYNSNKVWHFSPISKVWYNQ